jgi:hypothetical protein
VQGQKAAVSAELTIVNNFVNNYFMRLFTAFFYVVILFTAATPCSKANPLLQSSKGVPEDILAAKRRLTAGVERPKYPWKRDIVTTTFWIGQGSSSISDTTNYASAWDMDWTGNYGGLDDPIKRVGLLPRRFAPTLNPFYVALPFNDVKFQGLAQKYVPWWKDPKEGDRYKSQCKGRWIQIRNKTGRFAFGQWEDVGPLRYDHASYVFGNDRPRSYTRAGLDVSPAIRDYLGLDGMDLTDWHFVDASEVPPGPWMKYSEQAILYSALKPKETNAAKLNSETASTRKVARGRNG